MRVKRNLFLKTKLCKSKKKRKRTWKMKRLMKFYWIIVGNWFVYEWWHKELVINQLFCDENTTNYSTKDQNQTFSATISKFPMLTVVLLIA